MLSLLCSAFGCSGLVLGADTEHALYINEVVLSNSRCLIDETLGTPDWVEIYNASDAAVSLAGYGLSDDPKDPHKWVFPDVTIQPNGYLIVYAAKNDDDPMCTSFGLSRNGENLLLCDSFYNVIQYLEVPALSADISYARTASGEYGYCASPTPGAENGADIAFELADMVYSGSNSALHISEVMPKNKVTLAAADGNYYPWAELYNCSDSTILLSAYHLSDDVNDALKWQLPEITLEPGAYIVVFFSGKNELSSAAEPHASFKLGSEDDQLCIVDNSGQISMLLSWQTDIPSDISVLDNTCYCGFPTPGAANSDKVTDNRSFTAMDTSDPIRLNEALVENNYSISDEDGDRSSWVELYNASSHDMSLADYCLSDDPDVPFKWSLPDITIESGEYLVIFVSGKNKTDDQLHAPFSLSMNDAAILLSCRDGLRSDALTISSDIPENVSIGHDENGGMLYYSTPTPGARNSTHGTAEPLSAICTDMGGVYISEVCATNTAGSGKADWIELHNASAYDIDLSGWKLTDDPDEPDKFTLEDFTIPAGGYKIVTATTDSEKVNGVTAPFNISASGETLLLFDDDGELRDAFETGLLAYGRTSGRTSSDASRVYFTGATKGEANTGTAYSSRVMTPVFSDTTLYHTESFSLSITTQTSDASIYYTIDGSKPTQNSTLYTGPIAISANTPVRAIAYTDGMLNSDVASATFLFEEQHTLPVVCLNIASDDFDAVYSVTDRWKKVEREGCFEYYEADGDLCAAFPCGLKVSGASTLTMRQKSLSILLRSSYGAAETNYQFFPGSTVSTYKSLVLRNSGQDHAKARLRDSYLMRVVEGLNIDNVQTRLVVVYINGQYWGLYDLNENQNEDYLASYYDVDSNQVDIIRRNETPLAGDRYEFKRVRAYALNSNTADADVYARLLEWVDVDCFIDYVIAQTYFANSDMFNQKYWRSQDYTVKWRPVFYDLDWGFSASSPSRNMLGSYFKYEGVPSVDLSLTNMDIFVGLRRNQDWCDRFCARYVYVVKRYFAPARMTEILDTMEAEMEPEMQRHIARWGTPSSVSSWRSSVADLRECVQQRPDYALSALKKEFGLTNTQMQAYIDAAELAIAAETAASAE